MDGRMGLFQDWHELWTDEGFLHFHHLSAKLLPLMSHSHTIIRDAHILVYHANPASGPPLARES